MVEMSWTTHTVWTLNTDEAPQVHVLKKKSLPEGGLKYEVLFGHLLSDPLERGPEVVLSGLRGTQPVLLPALLPARKFGVCGRCNVSVDVEVCGGLCSVCGGRLTSC